MLLRFGFRSRYFSKPRLLPFTLAYQNAAPRRNLLLTLILNANSTPLVKRTPRRALWRMRIFCVLEEDLPLFLECLDFAGKMRFPLLHGKGLQTPANRHQFNSLGWKHTLNAVLLGCSVLVLESDISQYTVYSHSLWNIQKQLLKETRFSLSESQGRFTSLS